MDERPEQAGSRPDGPAPPQSSSSVRPPSRRETRNTRNTANILRILTYLGSQRGPVPAQSIISELGIPRSTAYELLDTLCQYGYAVSLASTHQYSLGTRAFELSSAYSRQKPLTRLGQVLLRNLVDRVGEAAHLAVLQGSDVVYLVEERAPHRPPLVTESGVRLPAHQTASGRAILAWMPRPQVRALYPHATDLPSRVGDRSPSNLRQLTDVLAETKRRGIAVEVEEVTPGLASVVVPVFGQENWPLAALGITFEIPRHPDVDRTSQDLYPHLRRFAGELGRRLGGDAR